MVFDSKLTWSLHVATTCKSMAYCLYMINFHNKSLPREMLVDALSVWGPAVHQNYCYIIEQAVSFVDCMHESEHVSRRCQGIN